MVSPSQQASATPTEAAAMWSTLFERILVSQIVHLVRVACLGITHVPDGENKSLRQALLEQIKAEPTNATAHSELGDYYAQRSAWVSAIAQYRTALAFAKSKFTLRSLAVAYGAAGYTELAETILAHPSTALGPSAAATAASRDQSTLQALDATRFQRLQAVARRIKELYPGRPPRVLDVGGGDGSLCLFLPEVEYVLVEPIVNGLSGTEMALPDRSFDVVSACHVLEHVPSEVRSGFLSHLCQKSRGHVLLLGPFAVNATGDDGLMDQLIYEITKVDWAAEHLACQLPTLDSIKEFAKRHELLIAVTPNGSRAAVFWMVFAYHFAGVAGKEADLRRVTRFFNAQYAEQMTNPLQPNDFLIEFTRPRKPRINSRLLGEHS